jgi:hypothetical protein
VDPAYALLDLPPLPTALASCDASGAPALLMCGPRSRWLVLARGGWDVMLNGLPLLTGFHLLRDRDELRLAGGARGFFSDETQAVLEPFPGADQALFCPRCSLEIESRQPAVRCPQCQIWHHQDEPNELPCWTHVENCTMCSHPTALESGFRWTPEGC